MQQKQQKAKTLLVPQRAVSTKSQGSASSPTSPHKPSTLRKTAVVTKTKQPKQPQHPEVHEDPVDEAMTTYVNSIWEMYDQDGNGELDREEAKMFVREMMSDIISSAPLQHAGLRDEDDVDEEGFEQIFRMLDTDGSGTIDKDEMWNYLKNICNINISV